MTLIAYALTADYQGTVAIDGADVPKFGGGVLAVGDGDFHVRDTLDAGDGFIVVSEHDQTLIDLLDAYPAVMRVDPPAGAEAISPYERRSDDALAHIASLRGLLTDTPAGAYGMPHRTELIAMIEAADASQAAALETDADTLDEPPAPAPADVSLDLTPDERLQVAQAVERGDILTDAELDEFVASTSIDEIVRDVDTDSVYAKRALAAELARGDAARRGLVDALTKIIVTTPEG